MKLARKKELLWLLSTVNTLTMDEFIVSTQNSLPCDML